MATTDFSTRTSKLQWLQTALTSSTAERLLAQQRPGLGGNIVPEGCRDKSIQRGRLPCLHFADAGSSIVFISDGVAQIARHS